MDVLACSKCREPFTQSTDDHLQCAKCKARFPLLAGLPWLWPDPELALLDWRNRFNRLQGELEQESTTLHENISRSATTDDKAQDYLTGLHSYRATLQSVLAPLNIETPIAPEIHLAMRTALPDHHAIDSYSQNIFRDWSWGTDENLKVADLLVRTVTAEVDPDKITTIVVLGAGAGRLTLDLHKALQAKSTVSLDSNPLLCFLAQQLMQGETIELQEFPRAPVDALVLAHELRLDADELEASKGINVVCADAFDPPLQLASVDLLVTPWFIDVVDTSLEEQLAVYASLLKPGGHWLNHGSLHFNRKSVFERLGASDVQRMSNATGFDVIATEQKMLPYLQNPNERQQRSELTYTQLSRRNKAQVQLPATTAYQPEWLSDPTLQVPLFEEFQTQITTTRVRGFIMSLVNGQRSITEIGKVLEEQKLMPAAEGAAAAAQLLRVMHNERLAQLRKD